MYRTTLGDKLLKSELHSTKHFHFVGYKFSHVRGEVSLKEVDIEKVMDGVAFLRILMSFIGIYNLEHTVPMDILHISVAWKFHWNIHNLYTFRYVVHSFTELVTIKGQETLLGDLLLSYGQPQKPGSTVG